MLPFILLRVCNLFFYFVHRNIKLLFEISYIVLIRLSVSPGNEISQVEGLEGLHQLRELVLDRNRIKALTENSFVGQNALLELHLAENRIRELNHLDPMTELRKLFLGLNKLQVLTSNSSSLLIALDILLFIFKFLLKIHIQIFNYTTWMAHTRVISWGDHQGHSQLLCNFWFTTNFYWLVHMQNVFCV